MWEQVPVLLCNFLAWSCGLSDDVSTEPVLIDKGLEAKVCSLAQDIFHLSTRKLLPKQLLLSVSAQHITGQKRIVNILNGFGHGASYPSVLEYNTAVAQESADSACGIPSPFEKSIQTTVVWDNNDFQEETLSGAGTTHCTTGIIIQRSSENNATVDISLEGKDSKCKRKRTFKRSFEAPEQDMPFEKKRKERIHFEGNIGSTQSLDRAPSDNSLSLDFLYYMCKCVPFPAHNEQSSMPSWTDFNKQINLPSQQLVSKVGYLPVVNANPTEMSTVNTVLHHSVAIADELELPSLVVVLDQALYAKAQQIRWTDDILKRRLVLRMGEFHTSMCFLAVYVYVLSNYVPEL